MLQHFVYGGRFFRTRCSSDVTFRGDVRRFNLCQTQNYEHVYSRKVDNKNGYNRYIQGEEKIMIKHSEKKEHNKTLKTKKYANCLHTDTVT